MDPEARRILDLARAARTPSERDKAEVERRLGAALGLSALAAGSAAAARAAEPALRVKAGAGATFKLWVACIAVGAVGAGFFAWSGRTPAASGTHTRTARVNTSEPASSEERAPATNVEPAVQPAQRPAPAKLAPAPAPSAAERAQPSTHSAGGSALEAELDLLHGAQAAWRAGDAARARALLAAHRARYPHSSLRPERDALDALVLCALGRRAEGEKLARALIVRAPSSPWRASLEQSCGLKR